MFKYEDLTACFLQAAAGAGLTTHPEHWTNAVTLEREFACTCHTGKCEEMEQGSSCTISFSWSTLDTALSLEGATGICEFFHDPDEHCPHLHTHDIPPLVLDLTYSLPLQNSDIPEHLLLASAQGLKMRASEHSRRTNETRPGFIITLLDNRLQPEAITLQQRVDLPIWRPEGMRAMHSDQASERYSPFQAQHVLDEEERQLGRRLDDEPQPEKWLPQIVAEVCQDILQVLSALDATRNVGFWRTDL